MRITITDEKRKSNNQSKNNNKNWFPAWKQKKVSEGTWKDKTEKGGKK